VRSDRGTECFTTPVNASADRRWTRAAILPRHLAVPFPVQRGCRAWAFSSHGASEPIEPLTPLSPLPLRGLIGAPSRLLLKLWLLRALSLFPCEEAAKAAVTTFS
jgi:hypothetical protein